MNEPLVRSWTRGSQSKSIDKPVPHFMNEFSQTLMDLTKKLAKETLGTAAHWLLHQHHWLNPQRRVSNIRIGDVVEFDLGVNYSGEFSYRHACIVLYKFGPLMTVVPLTSQGSGNGVVVAGGIIAPKPMNSDPKYLYRIEFEAPWSPGKWSVALVEQVRTISAERALFKWLDGARDARVPTEVLRAVQQRLVMMAAPLVYDMLASKDATIRSINRKKNDLLDKLKRSEQRVKELEKERDELDRQLETMLTLVTEGKSVEDLPFIAERRRKDA